MGDQFVQQMVTMERYSTTKSQIWHGFLYRLEFGVQAPICRQSLMDDLDTHCFLLTHCWGVQLGSLYNGYNNDNTQNMLEKCTITPATRALHPPKYWITMENSWTRPGFQSTFASGELQPQLDDPGIPRAHPIHPLLGSREQRSSGSSSFPPGASGAAEWIELTGWVQRDDVMGCHGTLHFYILSTSSAGLTSRTSLSHAGCWMYKDLYRIILGSVGGNDLI